jgi:hypothetical protein
MRGTRVFAGLVVLTLASGCGGEANEDEKVPDAPLAPGTCVNTDCSWPAASPFVPGTATTCIPDHGAPILVEWQTDPLEPECSAGECVAAPYDAAASDDGQVWTSARLLPKFDLYSETPLGFEIVRSAAGGALELAKTTHVDQPLFAPTMDATGMSVTSAGELDWVGPSPSSTGLSLLHYDRKGARTSAVWLISHAESSIARFTSHGITVAYSYVAGTDGSVDPPLVVKRVGVARFDSSGALRWNQAGFTAASPSLEAVYAMGVGSDGAVSLLLDQAPPVEEGAGQLIVRLASDGQVEWARWTDEPRWFGATNPVAGSFLLGGPQALDAIDVAGNGVWRSALPVTGFWDTVAVSQVGRIFLPGITPEQPTLLVSSDGASCSTHALELDLLLPTGNGNERVTSDPVFAPLADERFAFAGSGRFGLLRLP